MMYFITNNTQLFNTYEEVQFCSVEYCLQYFADKKVIGLDTETQGFDPYTKSLLLVQLGDENNQFAIDSTVDIQLFKPLLENPNKLFILHNAKFDLRFFIHRRILIKNVFDTFLAEKLLYLGYPSGVRSMSLQSCAENYLGIYLDKSVRGLIHKGITERVIIYGCNDVKYLIQIRQAQLIELEKNDLLTAMDIENRFVSVLAYIEYCGIKLDVQRWTDKMNQDKKRLEIARNELNSWVVTNLMGTKFVDTNTQGDLFEGFKEAECVINWASSKQVIPLLKHLGFNLRVKDKKTGQMKDSVEASVIEPQKHISSIASVYLNYKKEEKVVSTYGQTFLDAINPVSGRIHTQFTQLMDTTRLSCGGEDKDTGQDNINLQNIPADDVTRHCFVPNEGNIMIDCDYSGQEDFVFTELSQEIKLIEFYNDTKERDGHSFVAKMCFPEELNGVEEMDVKKVRKDLRSAAKTAKFAIHYGGNGLTVARNLSLPEERGLAVEKAYLKAFPGIDAYFKKVKKLAWDRGYVLISELTGHRSYIYDWKELKSVQAQFDSEFWSRYRAIKPDYNPDEIKDFEWKKKLVKRITESFANGYSLETLSQDFNVSLSFCYVELVKHYFKRKGASERMALNYPVQGTAAIITKMAGIRFYYWLIENDLLFKVLIPDDVHDEYLVECPVEISEMVASNLQRCMEEAGALFVKSVRLKAVPEMASYWIH